MNFIEVKQIIRDNGILADYYWMTDREYVSPTKTWFLRVLPRAIKAQVKKWSVDFYLKEVWDCDDWTRAGYVIAQACNASTYRKYPDARKRNAALAVFPFHYLVDGQSGNAHAILMAIVKRKCIWLEPQNGKELKLKQTEKNCCQGVG